MATCPYCSTKLLRHVRDTQVYWFCRHCWWELPLIDAITDRPYPRTQTPYLGKRQPHRNLDTFYPTYSQTNDKL